MSVQFDYIFFQFSDLVPLGINVMKNIGFQLLMCQFGPKFVLETKNVPLFWLGPIRSSRGQTSNMAEIQGLCASVKAS